MRARHAGLPRGDSHDATRAFAHRMTSRELLLIACGLIAVLSLPLILRWVRPNPLYGFRTPRTLARDDVWYPANAFAGRALLLAACAGAAALWLAPAQLVARSWFAPLAVLSPVMLAVVACFMHLHRYR